MKSISQIVAEVNATQTGSLCDGCLYDTDGSCVECFFNLPKRSIFSCYEDNSNIPFD